MIKLNGRVDTCSGIPEIVKTHFDKKYRSKFFSEKPFCYKEIENNREESNLAENGEFRFDRPNNGWADDPKRRTNLVWKP